MAATFHVWQIPKEGGDEMAPYCRVPGLQASVEVSPLDTPLWEGQLFLASIFFCVFQRVIGVIIILNFGLVLTAAFRVWLQNQLPLSASFGRSNYWRRWWLQVFGWDRFHDKLCLKCITLFNFLEGWGPRWVGLLVESRWKDLFATNSSLGLVSLWALRKCWDIRLTMPLEFGRPHW